MAFNFIDTLSGGAGAICCVYIGMPFDTVKVRMQTDAIASSQASRGLSMLGTFASTVKGEGIRALWKGATPALASALIENMTLFTMNGVFQRVAMHLFLERTLLRQSEERVGGGVDSLKAWQLYACGGLSGLCSSAAMCPMDVTKTRLQFQRANAQFAGPIDCMAQTVRGEGIRGLYRGLLPLMCRDVPFNAIFLGTYGATTQKFARLAGVERKDDLPLAYTAIAGGMAGAAGWGTVFPIDAVKARMMTARMSSPTAAASAMTIGQVIGSMYRANGLRSFYRGWSAAVLRAMPANAGLFAGAETVIRLYNSQ
jgi:Mitochondrial carrier protein